MVSYIVPSIVLSMVSSMVSSSQSACGGPPPERASGYTAQARCAAAIRRSCNLAIQLFPIRRVESGNALVANNVSFCGMVESSGALDASKQEARKQEDITGEHPASHLIDRRSVESRGALSASLPPGKRFTQGRVWNRGSVTTDRPTALETVVTLAGSRRARLRKSEPSCRQAQM